ncbi:protein INCREASED RESISTANCE TO MYZUS PERSICAE 1-like [Rosa rugosa]|uniref:protein INCREASED RESISTANCE TO MYZUS PERSICAE 1-like n=1 Tax=Rosa rugosa TaxID=74645 RepID=UPI002B4131DF|nr:protein INCREASED RESISTANCE TO MYZUS PERSICAE 1-like [Rosa rugosa]
MTGKRMRLVRSKTSFDDMTTLDGQLPPQERRQQMKPPSNETMIEKETPKVYHQPAATLAMWSSPATQGSFLDKCNYCSKRIGDKDEIYMYSSLQAFCSSECRIQQILDDKAREMMMCGQSAEALAWHQKMINNLKITWL